MNELDESQWWTMITREAALDPTTWLVSAWRLNTSAERLWAAFAAGRGPKWQEEWGDLPAALMLAGFALENLAKGLIIAKEPARVGEKELARWSKGSGHEIRELLAQAEVRIEDDERDTVHRLEDFAIWAGRYPVPRKFEENTPIDSLGHGFRLPELSDDKREAEWMRYRAVFKRAEAMFEGLIGDSTLRATLNATERP